MLFCAFVFVFLIVRFILFWIFGCWVLYFCFVLDFWLFWFLGVGFWLVVCELLVSTPMIGVPIVRRACCGTLLPQSVDGTCFATLLHPLGFDGFDEHANCHAFPCCLLCGLLRSVSYIYGHDVFVPPKFTN